MTLCRYVERNPVAAGLAASPGDWTWSSYRAHVGQADAPPWLDTAALYAQLLGAPPQDAAESARAARLYESLTEDAPAASLWQAGLTAQIFLGDAQFAARMQALASAAQTRASDISRAQQLPALSLSQRLDHCGGDRARALRKAHVEGGLAVSLVRRIIAGGAAAVVLKGAKSKT